MSAARSLFPKANERMCSREMASRSGRIVIEWLCLLTTIAIMCQQSLSRDLMLSHIIWREGVRGPLNGSTLPHIKWNDSRPAQLTQKGKEQHAKLADFLRGRYESVLLNWSPNSVTIYSVNASYSVSSLKANLVALFPNTSESWLIQNVSWTLKSLNAVEIADEAAASKLDECQNGDNSKRDNDSVKSILQSKSVLQKFQQDNGINLSHFYNVFMIYDSMSSAHAQGILPRNLETTYDLISMYFGRFTTEYFSKLNASREYAGFLLINMLENMAAKAYNSTDSEPQLVIYSTDQLLMISLLSLLSNYQEYFVPQFSSCFMVELYNDSGDYQVELWYKQSVEQQPVELKVPGCSPTCSLEQLTNIVSNVAKTPWRPVCKKKENNPPEILSKFSGKFTIVLFSAIVAGIIAALVTYYCARDVFKCLIQKPADE
ncbi:Lysosomal acid phosphatase [Trichuris trichiura]|uniref:Lysosomal acid phosphatase n=1 Tax=Trichuris trichiura TaxID=36087 RepID=A0A077ZIB4_TRITR|nr:Lysosomal acid phosphatase [Trichuris trichiura]